MTSLPIGIKLCLIQHTLDRKLMHACSSISASSCRFRLGKNQTSLVFTGPIECCQTDLSMVVRIALLGACDHTPIAYCITLMGPVTRTVSKNNYNIIIFSILCIYMLSTCTIAPGHEKKNGDGNLRKRRKISKILHQYVSCLNVLEQDH